MSLILYQKKDQTSFKTGGLVDYVCERLKIYLKDFYLPNDENKLHKEINQHLAKVEKLVDYLKSINAAPIIFVEEEIKQHFVLAVFVHPTELWENLTYSKSIT